MRPQQLIIVSNRLPVSVSKENGKLVFTPSSGGLATAMGSLIQSQNTLWIGWPGIAEDDLTASDKRRIISELAKYNCYPVHLTKEQIQQFYEGYSNGTLWPLFHYFQHHSQYKTAFWDGYKAVNARYSRTILRQAQEGAQFWVHDYQLMLLPRLLRKARPQSSIGFFLHIPFPSSEIFRLLPNRREILEGMLGADLLGFHTYDYGHHFMRSAQRTLGHESKLGSVTLKDRAVKIDTFPIGIDYRRFASATKLPAVKTEMTNLAKHFHNQRIILSIDRLDYSKGIPERLEAFEVFLKRNPQYHKKISLIVVAIPSRVEVEAYKNLRESVEQIVSRINGTYATVEWTPISYQFKNLPFEQFTAMFAMADVAMVTPLRDGMNLVAKEYVATKQKRRGVLVLSELTGAASELPEALHVNPNDRDGIVAALEHALRMPIAEQKQRLRAMQQRLSKYTVQRWAGDFLEHLQLAGAKGPESAASLLEPGERSVLINAYRKAKKRLLLLDYDGTLANFVGTPNAARAKPSKALLHVLERLSSSTKNTLLVVSGRPKHALQSWFNDMPLGLAAEHGAWIKHADGWRQTSKGFDTHKAVILPVLEAFAERTPGALIEEKSSALVWHYRNVTPELAYIRNESLKHELTELLQGSDIKIFEGNKIIEVKPSTVHKGAAAKHAVDTHKPDFVLTIGDDYTDEDMFKAVPESSFTVKIGPGESQARYRLGSVEEAIRLLHDIAYVV